MSVEAAISFWQAVESDADLQVRVNPKAGDVPAMANGLAPNDLSGLASIASETGHAASAEDFATVEAVLRFWEAVAADSELQAKLKSSDGTDEDAAAAATAEVASASGYDFDSTELVAVTGALVGTGWMTSSTEDEVAGFGLTQSKTAMIQPKAAFSTSFRMAVGGSLQTDFRRFGPGQVAEYM